MILTVIQSAVEGWSSFLLFVAISRKKSGGFPLLSGLGKPFYDHILITQKPIN
jgi:hypothetical protein